MLTGNMNAKLFAKMVGGMPDYIRKLGGQAGGLMAKAAPQQAPEQPKFDMGLFNQSFDKPKMTMSDKLGLVSGYLMDLDGSFGTGNADKFKGMYDERVDEQRSQFERKRQESIMMAAAQGDPTALAYLDPLGNRAFQYGKERDQSADQYRDKVWNAETQRWEKSFQRDGDWRKEDVDWRTGQAEEDKRRFGLNYGLDARRTSAAEATAAAKGNTRTRYLSPEEIKAAGYPEGAVVQVDAEGDDQVRFKPMAEFSAGEISGFRNKANTLADFQRNLNAYKAAVEQDGTITFYGANNKKAGNLDGLHQALIFGAKDLLSLGILSKDDYENLNKLIPDATGMGTLGQGKEALMAKLAPLEATITSQIGMIPEQYRSGAVQPSAATSATPKGPAPGTVKNGYRFKGGNPNDKNNWEPV